MAAWDQRRLTTDDYGVVAAREAAHSLIGRYPLLGRSAGFRPWGLAVGRGCREGCWVPVCFQAFLHGNGLWPRGISVASRATATRLPCPGLQVAAVAVVFDQGAEVREAG